MKIVRLILGLFAVIGLGLLIGGIFSVRHTRHFLQTAVSVPGVVTENAWQENRTSYSATIPTNFQARQFTIAHFTGIDLSAHTTIPTFLSGAVFTLTAGHGFLHLISAEKSPTISMGPKRVTRLLALD
jgi:hypothetical protein